MTTDTNPGAQNAVNAWQGMETHGKVWCDCPLHTLFPQRISDLVEPTLLDLQAACALIGSDTYGKPHWTPETIHTHNPVVQAFARHAVRAVLPAPPQEPHP